MTEAISIAEKVLKFLKQKSTVRGIAGILTAVGVGVSPENITAILTVGLTVIGVIEVFTNEEKPFDVLSEKVNELNNAVSTVNHNNEKNKERIQNAEKELENKSNKRKSSSSNKSS